MNKNILKGCLPKMIFIAGIAFLAVATILISHATPTIKNTTTPIIKSTTEIQSGRVVFCTPSYSGGQQIVQIHIEDISKDVDLGNYFSNNDPWYTNINYDENGDPNIVYQRFPSMPIYTNASDYCSFCQAQKVYAENLGQTANMTQSDRGLLAYLYEFLAGCQKAGCL